MLDVWAGCETVVTFGCLGSHGLSLFGVFAGILNGSPQVSSCMQQKSAHVLECFPRKPHYASRLLTVRSTISSICSAYAVNQYSKKSPEPAVAHPVSLLSLLQVVAFVAGGVGGRLLMQVHQRPRSSRKTSTPSGPGHHQDAVFAAPSRHNAH